MEDEPVGAAVAPVDGVDMPALASVDPECIAWIKSKVHLQAEELAWQPEHDETIAEFIVSTSSRRLFAFIDPVIGALTLQIGVPQMVSETEREVQYFLKPEKMVLTIDTIAKHVQFGSVNGSPVGALLRLMSGVFVPLCLKDQSWPDTIKKEFSGQLHRFMASLTETAWDQRGTTTLYIPSEDLEVPELAAKQKDLVQRLVRVPPSNPRLSQPCCRLLPPDVCAHSNRLSWGPSWGVWGRRRSLTESSASAPCCLRLVG